MSGLGERLLVLGLADAALLAILATKVGLTGRACGADPSEAAVEQARRRAIREGVLVELEQAGSGELPYDPASFDVIVIRARGDLAVEANLASAVAASRRLLRDGGRCVAIADAAPTGLERVWGHAAGPSASLLLRLFAEGGYRATRLLAERERLSFVEAVWRAHHG